mgnify:CR=1 FL=1
MIQFIHFIYSAPNFIATFILSFCLLYWIIVMLGAIDMDMFDIDIDVDVDMDADMDVDADTSGNSVAGVTWLHKVLHFFNLGRIPFMIWLTIVGLITWFGVVSINYFLRLDSFLIGVLIFIACFIVSMLVSKPIMYPLVRLFDAIENTEGLKNAVGQIGEVRFSNRGTQPGEVEIVHDGSHIKIYALPSSQEIKLTKNQKVLVIAKSEDDDQVYIVEPYN